MWLVGRDLRSDRWDLVGVFAWEQEALAECDAEGMFVLPLTVGERLSTTHQHRFREHHGLPSAAMFDRVYPHIAEACR